jgi:small subunit ribosomal protein S2
MKALLESGVHFGHRTHRWNPHMKPYIFTERNGIHIINLQLTVKALENVYQLVVDTVADGGTVLFVGTKRQAQETIQNEAVRCGMPYVNARWLGGMLTNYRTIRERINELERLERMRDGGEFARVTKKEALMLTRKIDKLEMRLSGTRNMTRLPDLLFAVDVRREETAIHEANLLDIPVIAMVDTNCDPGDIDYIIPSNDDAIRAIKLIVGKVADAVLEGKAMLKEVEVEAEAEFAPVAGMMTDDRELTDEELLGEATLAKMREVEEEQAAAAAAAVAAAEAQAEAAAEAAEAEAQAEAETAVEGQAEPQTEQEAVAEVEPEPQAEQEAAAEVEPEAPAEEEAVAEVEAEPQAEEEVVAEVEAEPQAEEEAAAEVEPEPQAEKEAVVVEVEPEAPAEVEPEPQAEEEAVAEVEAEPQAEEEAAADIEAEPQAEAVETAEAPAAAAEEPPAEEPAAADDEDETLAEAPESPEADGDQDEVAESES